MNENHRTWRGLTQPGIAFAAVAGLLTAQSAWRYQWEAQVNCRAASSID
jgi:hypothetical protein